MLNLWYEPLRVSESLETAARIRAARHIDKVAETVDRAAAVCVGSHLFQYMFIAFPNCILLTLCYINYIINPTVIPDSKLYCVDMFFFTFYYNFKTAICQIGKCEMCHFQECCLLCDNQGT